MKIVIVGGVGYIGSHVVLAALDHGYEVTVFDDLSTSNKSNINPNANFIIGSTKSKKDLSNLFKDNHYDGIIHLAAEKAAGESMTNPKLYTENNIIGSLNLIDKCVEHKIKNFIFSSSAAVYGNPQYNPIDEFHPRKPKSYYGYTKLAIEENLKWYSRLYSFKYASLRYFNAAGYDIKNRIKGLEINSKNLIPNVMEVAIGLKPYLPIFGNQYKTKDGTGVRDYVHVNDLAKAHIKALEYLINKKKDLIINLGTEQGYSVMEILKAARKITEINIPYKIENFRPGDIESAMASCVLAKDKIGWTYPNSSLEKIIESTWKVYKDSFFQ